MELWGFSSGVEDAEEGSGGDGCCSMIGRSGNYGVVRVWKGPLGYGGVSSGLRSYDVMS